MSRTTNLAFRFLRELNSKDVQDTFESLGELLEYLETKNDPDPKEIKMVDAAYQALEKLKHLEGLMKVYIGESEGLTKGNKLQKLYDKNVYSGSNVMFD
jgi:hypothetical protein